MLAQIETEKLEIKRQVTANVERLLLPIVERMKRRGGQTDRRQLELLEGNVRELTSEFGLRLGNGSAALSAREMEICAMIRGGLSSKEMAESLKVSVRTVDVFRNRIRKKLGISNRGVNLFAHLQTLA